MELTGGVAIALSLLAAGANAQLISESKLLDAGQILNNGYLTTYQATFTRDTSKGDAAGLNVQLPNQWSLLGQRWNAAKNWAASNAFGVKIENLENSPARLVIRFEDTADYQGFEQQLIVIPALETIQIVYDLDVSTVRAYGLKSLPSGYATPHVHLAQTSAIDLRQIYGWQLYNRGTNPVRLRVWDAKLLKVDTDPIGLIDRFGQPAFGTWDGKITGPTDMAAQRAEEDADLALNPGPGGLQGSTTLPSQAPSNRWRTIRYPSGRWYLVHPSGRLFWSMGITTVRYSEGTPLTGREMLFQQLPLRVQSSPHYGTLLRNGQQIETVNFASANLEAKYGSNWRSEFSSRALDRVKSWGFNTLGDWADPSILPQSDVPYLLGITTNEFPTRLPTTINSRTLPDPFDPSFPGFVANRLALAIAGHNGRPEFMGVYVDGELPWGAMDSNRNRDLIAFMVLNSPDAQPAKRVLMSMLRRKYGSISRLNRSWGTSFTSWRTVTDPGLGIRPIAHSDLREFVAAYALKYYRTVANAFTATGCTGLYFGSREGWQSTPEVAKAAARFVDVFSMGIYQRPELVDWDFGGIDKPVIVSEFSFGATDRGSWNPGPVSTTSQDDRSNLMRDFYLTALQSNKVVGAHWFQYFDQHASGRFDEENYNMGFVSIADNPHREMVSVARSIGGSLYSIRGLGGGAGPRGLGAPLRLTIGR